MAAWAVFTVFAAENVIYDFKPDFAKLPDKEQSKEVFVEKAPAFRLDSANVPGKGPWANHVGRSFYLFNKQAQTQRGKVITAMMKVRRLSGTVPFKAGIRVFDQNGKVIGNRNLEVSPAADGKWYDAIISCLIPDQDGISNINISIGFFHSGTVPNVFVIDNLKFVTGGTDSGLKAIPADSLGWAQAKNREKLALVSGGQPLFSIVVAEKPDPIAFYAAKELQEHIRLATGKMIEIRRGGEVKSPAIWIGDTVLSRKYGVNPALMGPDSWCVVRVGNDIIISGGDAPHVSEKAILSRSNVPLGTLFATYEFLECIFDIRWFWPGSFGTVVPKAENISIGRLFETGTPAYTCRSHFYELTLDKDIPRDELYKWHRRIRSGGSDDSPIGMHSFRDWHLKYADKPYLFALQGDGKRKVNNESGVHLCLTNPEVVERSAQDVIDYFKKFPNTKFQPVMPGDSNELYFCCCENCRKTVTPERGRDGLHSNAVWAYVNAVAAKVAQACPGKFIKCCAYADYRRPPDFPLMPNIAVTLCIGPVPQGSLLCKTEWHKVIDEWRVTGATLYIWEYWCSSRYKRGTWGAPALFARQLKELYMLDRGLVRGRAIELADIDFDGNDLRSWSDWILDMPALYIAGKLMWNPSLDVEDELQRYYHDFFGPAENQMREFHDILEEAWLHSFWQGEDKVLVWDHETIWKKTYPPEMIDRLIKLLRDAVRKTEGREPYAWRTKKMLEYYSHVERNSLLYRGAGKKPQRNTEIELPKSSTPAIIDGKIARDEWIDAVRLSDFVDSLGVAKIESKTEFFLKQNGIMLYIAAISPSPAAHKILNFANPAWGARDALLWNVESVELLFAGKDGERRQFIVAPDNKIFDARWLLQKGQPDINDAAKWNPDGVKFATSRNGNNWEMEIAIPLDVLNFCTLNGKQQIHANFARNHYYKTDPNAGGFKWEQSLWLSTGGGFDKVERYGTLTLK